MKYCYSALNNAFYPCELRANYVAAGEWPDDATKVTDEIFIEFALLTQPTGKRRVAGEDGLPMWDDIPQLSISELIADAEAKKTALLLMATEILGPLADAVDLEIATEDEEKQCVAWRKYRVLLMRIDVTQAPNIQWPAEPNMI